MHVSFESMEDASRYSCSCCWDFPRSDSLGRHELACRAKLVKRICLAWSQQKTCSICWVLYGHVAKTMRDGNHTCQQKTTTTTTARDKIPIKKDKAVAKAVAKEGVTSVQTTTWRTWSPDDDM